MLRMKYLEELYTKLNSFRSDAYKIEKSGYCQRVDEFTALAMSNIQAFKTVPEQEQRKLIVSRHSFIISNAHSFCAFRLLCEYRQRRLYIYEFHVFQDYQRRGLGQMLLDEIERLLAFLGLKYIALTVDVYNEAGVSFWRKNGFKAAPENPTNRSYRILLKKL